MSGEIPCAIFRDKEEGDCYVERRCPKCGRMLAVKSVSLTVRGDGLAMARATCTRCGDVKPSIVGWF